MSDTGGSGAGNTPVDCFADGLLERISHRKMEGKIPLEIRRDHRETVASAFHRVDGLHTSVETQDQEVEVEAYTQSVRYGQLLVEAVEPEHTLRIDSLRTDVPDVSGIDEQGTVQFPEQQGPVFKVQVDLDVSRMVDIIDAVGISLVGTRSEGTDAPSADTATPIPVWKTRALRSAIMKFFA